MQIEPHLGWVKSQLPKAARCRDDPFLKSRWSDRGQIQRADIYRLVKRRAANAGINVAISPHSFRVAVATAFLATAELATSAPVASARPMARAARPPIERART
jgi:site-specific recombinase XerD